MFKYTLKYKDFDGFEREEDFYFHLSTPELIEMHVASNDGLDKYFERVMNSNNPADLIATFKDLITRSYGIKSDDGRVFEKSKEISERFTHTAAYEKLYMELATDSDLASKFANGIIPANFEEEIKKIRANEK